MLTVTAIGSERYGGVADPANPALLETTCVVPSTRMPGDPPAGAMEWFCRYRVWIEGDPGEATDTVTVTVLRADGTESVLSDAVLVMISTATGAISGTITDIETGTPLANILVDASLVGRYAEGGIAFTDKAGFFDIQALKPGEYTLLSGNTQVMESVYAREWWKGHPDWESADLVTVLAGQVTTVDWALTLGGVIEGTVTDEVAGVPISGVNVGFVYFESESPVTGMGAFTTDEAGVYRISGLQAGDYLVCFYPDEHEPECWNNRTVFGDDICGTPGDRIPVALHTVISGIDAALAPVSSHTTEPPPDTLPFTGMPWAGGPASMLALVVMTIGAGVLFSVTRRRRPRNDC
jgi:protocatechuate 3,4-dioxygenase beta subunit